MKKEAVKNRAFRLALGSVLSVALASVSTQADAKPTCEGHEKCFGLAKKGMND